MREAHNNTLATVFPGNSEMAQRMRSFDWAHSELGVPESWPETLRSSVRICLASRHPIVLWWGRSTFTQFYNDAYISILGPAKHPTYLGRSGQECWSEIWSTMWPMWDKVFRTGEANWSEDFLYVLNRNLPHEEGYFNFSYSPMSDERGIVEGIFCACYETTGRVIGERRLKTLRDLGRTVADAKTAEAACKVTAETLASNPADIPFALIYLLDRETDRARLAARTGLEADSDAAPDSIDMSDPASDLRWPLRRVLDTRSAELVTDLSSRFEQLSSGCWPEPPSSAMVLPIAAPGQSGLIGFLVAAFSPRRVIDADYRSFFELLAGHVATAVANARAYEEERKRADALAEIDRAKTIFFSNVSHEFRTPLTLMLGPLQDLLTDSKTHLSPSAKEQLEIVNRNGARLLRLVNTLLDFSRIEAGRIQAVYQPTDLAQFTSELASVFRSATDKAGLRLVTECFDLGEPVYVDRDLWEKIVLNLISNAFKFTFEGEIVVSLAKAADKAELRVRDTGVGIPPKEIARVFERFHRVPNTRSRTHEGSGIGLALVHELVKLHGGSIHVESEVGRGTTFIVSLPFGTSHLPAGQIGSSRKLSSTATSATSFIEEALRWLPDAASPMEDISEPEELLPLPSVDGPQPAERPRVLFADDNADMRQYVARLLAKQCEVETAADGHAAFEIALKRPPNLILSDVMMPTRDGFELLNAIRSHEQTRSIPVVLLSARAGEESRVEGMQAGADDYLIKPFSARELLARISARLEIARLQQERESQLRLLTEISDLSFHGQDSKQLTTAACQRLASYMGVSRCGLTRVDTAGGAVVVEQDFSAGLGSLVGQYPLEKSVTYAFDDAKAGPATHVTDTRVDPRTCHEYETRYAPIGVRSFVTIPLHRDGAWVADFWVCHHEPRAWKTEEISFLKTVGDRLWMGIEAARISEALQRNESALRASQASLEQRVQERTQKLVTVSQELRELSARILQAQDEERRRVARELHDGTGQLLAALSMEIAKVAAEREKLSAEAESSVGSMESLIAQMNADIRTMSHLLYPPLLDEVGLKSALQEYIEGFAERSGIDVTLDLPSRIERLDREFELCLFRIIQECLTNIHRHSKSKVASIRLAREADVLRLEVRDEGTGVSKAKLVQLQFGGNVGVGIRGMRERVRQFSGEMTLDSDSKGTRVRVAMPIPKRATTATPDLSLRTAS